MVRPSMVRAQIRQMNILRLKIKVQESSYKPNHKHQTDLKIEGEKERSQLWRIVATQMEI